MRCNYMMAIGMGMLSSSPYVVVVRAFMKFYNPASKILPSSSITSQQQQQQATLQQLSQQTQQRCYVQLDGVNSCPASQQRNHREQQQQGYGKFWNTLSAVSGPGGAGEQRPQPPPSVGAGLEATSSSSGMEATTNNNNVSPGHDFEGTTLPPLDHSEKIILPEIEMPEVKMTKVQRMELWMKIAEMEQNIEQLVKVQDYSLACQLKDKVDALRNSDPWVDLRNQMEIAVKADEFMKGARLRLQMDKIGAPPENAAKKFLEEQKNNKGRPVALDSPIATTNSPFTNPSATSSAVREKDGSGLGSAVTRPGGEDAVGRVQYSSSSEASSNGVRVHVRSEYFPEQSNPKQNQFIFIYHVQITNDSPETVQLVSRTWIIQTVNSDKPQVVKGPGVVGQQPVLEPGESFRYTSACPLNVTPLTDVRVLGQMQGSYLMATGAMGEKGFEAKINPFHFILPPKSRGDAPSPL